MRGRFAVYMPLRIRLHLSKGWTVKTKAGRVAVIDRVCAHPSCASHMMFRVVNLWKSPKWLDSQWFQEFVE